MRIAIFALLIGCTPATQSITPAHPAHPDAESGRLAGPPAALRPGVAEVTPAEPRDEHAGHEMPATPLPPDSQPPSQELPDDMKPPTPGTPLPESMKPPAESKPSTKKPAAKKPAKKPPAKAPAKDPHEGHAPAKPAKPADDPHKGHHGH